MRDTPSDRRQFPRMRVFDAVAVDVWLEGAGGHERRSGRLVDLGHGGALLALDDGYPLGTRVSVRFQLVRLGEVNCRAIVRRDVAGQGVGVEFLDLSATEQKRLSALFAEGAVAPPNTPSDRRQSPRLEVFGADDVDVWVDGAEGQERRTGRLVDLAAGGACLALDDEYAAGTCLSVRFQLVRLGEINCRAIVRRDIEGNGVGVEFLDLEAPERERLAELFTRPRSRSAPRRLPA